MTIHYDEKGKFFTDIITKVPVPSTIQTLTHRIHGSIHVRQNKRLKDSLNEAEEFLAITDAVVYNARGQTLYRTQFIAIRREHVVWVLPDNERLLSDESTTGQEI
jgi:hypothetical protein